MNYQYILFYSPTCGPCEDITPLVDKFSKTHTVTQIEDNTDNEEFLDAWGIEYLPTMLILSDDKTSDIIKKITGVEAIEKYIYGIIGL